ncbi:MAG: DUF2723 domain-containing protein [Bacteroidetes bacterium]|nr:DUF2723 domain-containing protein [Bacteroidota bacterium]
MQKYKLLNNIFGVVSFIFAAVVYTMTMESSGSFWDCGEFVSGCYKLQVVHPPGAPFFLILGRIFTLFSGADPLTGGNPSNVALTVNLMSALATAASVMFLYWTVTALAKKLVFKDGEYTTGRIITVIGAGLIAATSCTFLDSLWFSAVEGEVYALSQFFMSFIVWAMMKWESDDSKYADHWLVLIAYMTGVSIGVHLLSLLALPALAMIYYYKKFKTTLTGWLTTAAIGFGILGFYMKFIISFTQSYLAGMDLFFVNTLHLSFNSGVIFGVVLLLALIVAIIRYTHTGTEKDYRIAMGIAAFYVLMGLVINDSAMARFVKLFFIAGLWAAHKYGYEARRILNIGILSIAFSYIGYISYLMVPIRSMANPPINMNRPTDPFTLKSYVDREQYGDRPLLRGPDYTVSYYDIEDYITTGERWRKDAKSQSYVFDGNKQDYKFRSSVQMLFPRLGFWQEDAKKNAYRAWLNPDYNVINRQSNEIVKSFPPNNMRQATDYANNLNKDGGNQFYVKDDISFGDNLRFFFKYQVGYMYFRYFFWNLAGRQNDIQGTYGNDDGRWISGIPFIDNSGRFFTPDWPQENLSQSMLKNKARNKFYMIPFVIGMIGLIYLFYKDEKTFWVVLVLFGTTGFLQIIYQNEPPIEPRERDYAIASSFLTFTIWIGYGVIAIIEFLRTRLKLPDVPAALGTILLCASAPFLMGSQGWDDHTRHHRYTARDFAIDYLESCAPNAVLFTQGDNDTYPLWYAQEVEGIRTDIRIINLSLLGVDWYIDQLRYKMNDAPALKMSFTPDQYSGSKRDRIRYRQHPSIPQGKPENLKHVMKFIASEQSQDRVPTYQNGELENYLPTKDFYLDMDTNRVKEMNMLATEDESQMVSRMQWSIDNNDLLKNDWMTLDIVASNIAERPIYFAVSVSPDAYLGLEKYFQLEGLTYRVVPKVNPSGSPYSAPPRTDVMYENMMKKFKFGGITENPHIYLDENILRMTVNIRGNYGRLADALLAKGEKEKAAGVIDYSLKSMPPSRVPHSVFNYSYPEVYYQAGQKEKGRKLLTEIMDKAKDELRYYQTVYKFVLEEARKSGDMGYYSQLQQGQFTERREVREQLYIMQELAATAKRNEDPEFIAKVEKDFNDSRMAFTQSQNR